MTTHMRKKRLTRLAALRRGDVVGMDYDDGSNGTATILSVKAGPWTGPPAVIKSAGCPGWERSGYVVTVTYTDSDGEARSELLSSDDEIYILERGESGEIE